MSEGKQKVYKSYMATVREIKLKPELLDFMKRRTDPFLDAFGKTRSLEHLLQEAYMQGMSDATQVLGTPPPQQAKP